MAHFAAVVVAGDLIFPIAPDHLQRIIEPEQELHIVLVTAVQQLVMGRYSPYV